VKIETHQRNVVGFNRLWLNWQLKIELYVVQTEFGNICTF